MIQGLRIVVVNLALIGWSITYAQRAPIKAAVVDSASEKPLAGVIIHTADKGDAVTTKNGFFEFHLSPGQDLEMEISYTGYVTQFKTIPKEYAQGDGRSIIRLVQDVKELTPVVIRPGPQVVYQRQDLHIGAYYTNSDGVWVLVYEKPKLWHSTGDVGQQVFRNARLYLLDTLFKEVNFLDLNGEVFGLHHDHAQRLIIEGEQGVWAAKLIEKNILLLPLRPEALHTKILPWTDSIPGLLLGSNLSRTYPSFDHFAYDPINDKAQPICAVEDKFLMELFRSEYKYMSGADKVVAMNLEHDLGIDKEIIAGYMTRFYDHLYFKVPYAPLFTVNDTLYVFDKYKPAIRKFTKRLKSAGEAEFNEKAGNDRWKELIQDRRTGTVYARIERGPVTWLRPINATTGKWGEPFKLGHPFPEEVQVENGYVYFVYRTAGSLQRRSLYREALN